VRSFSTTSRQQDIKPESPRYIEIPHHDDTRLPSAKPRKGVLPAPREIFNRRSPDKASEKYLNRAAPRSPRRDANATSDYAVYKRNLAERRRQNLREGLTELQSTYKKEKKQHKAYNTSVLAQRERLRNAPTPDDELFTAASQPLAAPEYRQRGAHLPDPEREERLARKLANYEAHNANKKEVRLDALQDLYHTASTPGQEFITDQKQLDVAIDRIFVPTPKEWKSPNGHDDGSSIWTSGPPDGISEMLARGPGKDTLAIRSWAPTGNETRKRVERIGEILTGGKLNNKH
jgi:hypothetical protein